MLSVLAVVLVNMMNDVHIVQFADSLYFIEEYENHVFRSKMPEIIAVENDE